MIQWAGGSSRRGWLPWLWFGLAALPATLFLTYSYTSAAPRVIMLAGVGASVLWAEVIVQLSAWLKRRPAARRLARIAPAGLAMAILAPGALFIQEQMALYQLGGRVVSDVVAATVAANGEGKRGLFFNLPVWLTAGPALYPIGQEGVMLMPAQDKLETLVAVHTGRPASLAAFRRDEIRRPAPYYDGLMGGAADWSRLANVASQVFVTGFDGQGIAVEKVGVLPAEGGGEPLGLLPPYGELREATARWQDGRLEVDLLWALAEPLPGEVTVFVHALDESGQLIGQLDGDPLGGTLPLSQWPAGLAGADRRTAALERPAATVLVGVYSRATGERWALLRVDGDAWPDNAVAIPVS
jgi:hypothetical protein